MRRRRRNTSEVSLFAFQDIITCVTGIMIFITLLLAVELLQRTEASPPKRTAQAIEQIESQLEENDSEIQRLQRRLSISKQPASRLAVLDASTLRRRLEKRRQQNAMFARQIQTLQRENDNARKRRDSAIAVDARTKTTEEATLKDLKQKIRDAKSRLKKITDGKRIVYNVGKGSWSQRWIVQISGKEILAARIGAAVAPSRYATETAFRAWAAGRKLDTFYFLLIVKPSGIPRLENVKKYLKSEGADAGVDLIGEDQSAIDPKTGAGGP